MESRRKAYSAMIVALSFGVALGLALGGRDRVLAQPVAVPTPVYRVPLGLEAEEVRRSIQQLEYLYQQLLFTKKMVQAGDWTGIGRLVGSSRLTGLIDSLDFSFKATPRVATEFETLFPTVDPSLVTSTADFARKVAQRNRAALLGKTNILQVVVERYADGVVNENGAISEYPRANSVPAYIEYAKDVNNSLGLELKRLNSDGDAGLMRAMQLNSQIQLTSQAVQLYMLQALCDQNRVLSLMAGESLKTP